MRRCNSEVRYIWLKEVYYYYYGRSPCGSQCTFVALQTVRWCIYDKPGSWSFPGGSLRGWGPPTWRLWPDEHPAPAGSLLCGGVIIRHDQVQVTVTDLSNLLFRGLLVFRHAGGPIQCVDRLAVTLFLACFACSLTTFTTREPAGNKPRRRIPD